MSELNSSIAALHRLKEAFFHLECKNADMIWNYDKLLPKFEAYHKAAEQSKSVAVLDTYKLGSLDCKSGAAPCYFIEDEDIETFCPNMPPAQSEYINAIDIKAAKQ